MPSSRDRWKSCSPAAGLKFETKPSGAAPARAHRAGHRCSVRCHGRRSWQRRGIRSLCRDRNGPPVGSRQARRRRERGHQGRRIRQPRRGQGADVRAATAGAVRRRAAAGLHGPAAVARGTIRVGARRADCRSRGDIRRGATLARPGRTAPVSSSASSPGSTIRPSATPWRRAARRPRNGTPPPPSRRRRRRRRRQPPVPPAAKAEPERTFRWPWEKSSK